MEKENEVWREAWRTPWEPIAPTVPAAQTDEETFQEQGEAQSAQPDPGQAGEKAAPDTPGQAETPEPDGGAVPDEKRFLYPMTQAKLPDPPKVNTGEEHVLLVQLVLCALFLAFAWFARSADAPFLPELRGEAERMMTQGIEFSTENAFARFADALVEELRLKVRGLLQRLEEPDALAQGEGGYWPVGADRAVPEGATLNEYTLPIELSAPVTGSLTSGYGFRVNPVNAADDFHAGIDIAADEGTPVLAAQDGLVVRTGYTRLRGYYVIVRHAGGVQTLYQHLSLIFVRGGESVTQGQTIAATGSTGFVTGPHLHLELILDGVRVDPLPSFAGITG